MLRGRSNKYFDGEISRERNKCVLYFIENFSLYFSSSAQREIKTLRLWSSSVANINNRRIPNMCRITIRILLSSIIPMYLSLFRYIFFNLPANSYHASNNFRNTQILCTRSLILSPDTFARAGKISVRMKTLRRYGYSMRLF